MQNMHTNSKIKHSDKNILLLNILHKTTRFFLPLAQKVLVRLWKQGKKEQKNPKTNRKNPKINLISPLKCMLRKEQWLNMYIPAPYTAEGKAGCQLVRALNWGISLHWPLKEPKC